MKGKCCNGMLVSGLFSIVGVYVLTWGLIGSANFTTVLKDPIFWGLVLILCGFCSAVHKHM